MHEEHFWHVAYVELYFTDVLCPEFDTGQLELPWIGFVRGNRGLAVCGV